MTRAVATGEFVAQHLNDGDVPDERVQPNGVDLTIETLYRTSGRAYLNNGDYLKPDRIRVPSEGGTYSIPTGQYPVVYADKVEIPEGYVGRVYPRSRLMRCGLHLTSALWDQGYEGVGEGLLQVPRALDEATIQVDMPIAQMVFLEADKAESDYDGSHQRERIEAE